MIEGCLGETSSLLRVFSLKHKLSFFPSRFEYYSLKEWDTRGKLHILRKMGGKGKVGETLKNRAQLSHELFPLFTCHDIARTFLALRQLSLRTSRVRIFIFLGSQRFTLATRASNKTPTRIESLRNTCKWRIKTTKTHQATIWSLFPLHASKQPEKVLF